MKELLKKAKLASYEFALTPFSKRKKLLEDIANALEVNTSIILKENAKDLDPMDKNDPLYDRMLLTETRILDIASSCREIAKQEDVLGKLLEQKKLASGMTLRKVSVPMGVVACIYEARPNVTVDIAALCLFTGNVVILRGSSSAENSNKVLIDTIHKVLESNGIPKEVVSKYSINREELQLLFSAVNEVDLLIPRGGKGLIDRVRRESIVPVIETGAGVCHTYVDETADIDMAVNVVVNAKTSRPSVCNALDCMIVHKDVSKEFFPKLVEGLSKFNVVVHADSSSFNKFPKGEYLREIKNEKEGKEVYGKEFLGYEMSVKTVNNLDEAISHINTYGSRHSEAILTNKKEDAEKFFKLVDASSLYHNASTRFTDGGCFGLGAEIGISTQKLHARGPVGAETLTTYKYLIEGDGNMRK